MVKNHKITKYLKEVQLVVREGQEEEKMMKTKTKMRMRMRMEE
jgi:hypothetical protein